MTAYYNMDGSEILPRVSLIQLVGREGRLSDTVLHCANCSLRCYDDFRVMCVTADTRYASPRYYACNDECAHKAATRDMEYHTFR